MIVNGKEIHRCYHECPYFSLDGGPSPVMYCGHPSITSKNFADAAIISHPDCDTGFPKLCPEVRLQKGAGQ